MTDIALWLESPGNEPVKIVVDDRNSLNWLKSRLVEQSQIPNFRTARSISQYQIVSRKTGLSLRGENTPLYHMLSHGDHISVIEDTTVISPENKLVAATQPVSSYTPPMVVTSTLFSIAAINPVCPDYDTEYPVLAVVIKYIREGQILGRHNQPMAPESRIYSKESSFLVYDAARRFKLVKAEASLRFSPSLHHLDLEEGLRKLSRYSIHKYVGESKNMIYPIRPFSITAINMEGFDRNKAYPVLAIDMDQYFQARPVADPNPDEEIEPIEPTGIDQPTSMAFFLVGDENGEFAWIAEDECRLALFNKE